MSKPDDTYTMTVQEAAAALSLSYDTVLCRLKRGELRGFRNRRGHWAIPVDAVLADRTHDATPPPPEERSGTSRYEQCVELYGTMTPEQIDPALRAGYKQLDARNRRLFLNFIDDARRHGR